MERSRKPAPPGLGRDHGSIRRGSGGGASTPTRQEKRPEMTRRKQTLLTLLDALQELQNEDLGAPNGGGGRKNTAMVDDPGEGPNTDDQIQAEGARAFEIFQLRVQDLDRQLQKFSNAVTQLGSSVGLLSSSFHLRQRLSRILFLVRDNASELFPRKIRKDSSSAQTELLRSYSRAKLRYKPPPNVARPLVSDELDVESFPEEVEGLAKDTINFLDCLNEFPEFCDEAVNASIIAFEGDLKYWASCLREFEGQFRYPGVTRYVHDLSTEIGEHLENITAALVVFVEVGVPTIKFGQKHGTANLLNLSTIATFFSAVTATTIQFSFERTEFEIDHWVNGFWYSSLVFSIASAVNSLVGLTWRQAMYRSPGHRVPWWVLIWIKRSPLVFLIISVTAFSVGLCLFTYASHQPPLVCTLITTFTACSSFGLLAVSSWFVFERLVYSRHKGQLWLDDILREINRKIMRLLGLEWALRTASKYTQRAADKSAGFYRSATRRFNVILPVYNQNNEAASRASESDIEVHSLDTRSKSTSPTLAAGGSTLTFGRKDSGFASPPPLRSSPEPQTPMTSSALLTARGTSPEPEEPAPPRNLRLKNAVRSVMMLQAAGSAAAEGIGRSQRAQAAAAAATAAAAKSTAAGDRRAAAAAKARRNALAPLSAGRLARIAATRTALEQVAVTQNIPAHQALVRNLAFSPNGQLLATCSWDRTSALLKTSDMSSHRVLAHPHGFVGQVMWSPDGSLLLTKLTSGVNVWTSDGVLKQRIERRTAVHSITWFASGQEFLSIETNEAVHVDVQGKIIDRYPFERLQLHDVAITRDGSRLFAVATLEQSKEGYKPVKARAEKRIVVYNRLEKEIENQVPVLHDVRDITLSHDDKFALISYENKAPPQLWRVNMIKDDARLALVHTYMPNKEIDFAGPSYFGGKHDQLVFCASKAGDIYVWDRESGTLLRHFDPGESDGDLTCIAWNNGVDSHMFCTGSHDGTVRLWTPSTDAVRNSIIDPVASDTPRTTLPAPAASPSLDPPLMVEEPQALVDGPTILLQQTLGAVATELRGDDDGYFTPHEPTHDESRTPRPEYITQERKRTISFSDPPARPE